MTLTSSPLSLHHTTHTKQLDESARQKVQAGIVFKSTSVNTTAGVTQWLSG